MARREKTNDYEVLVSRQGESAMLIVRASNNSEAQKIALKYAEKNVDQLFGCDEPDICVDDCNVLRGGAEMYALRIDVDGFDEPSETDQGLIPIPDGYAEN